MNCVKPVRFAAVAWVLAWSGFAQPAFDPAANLLVHYGFESNLTDQTTNGNDATVYAGTPAYAGAMFGDGISFDGSTSIQVPVTVLGDMSGKTMTAWVKHDGGSVHFIGAQSSISATDRFYISSLNGQLCTNTGPTDTWFGFTPYTPGDGWRHVALSVSADGLTSTMYINGALAPVDPTATDTGVNVSNLLIDALDQLPLRPRLRGPEADHLGKRMHPGVRARKP